MFCFLPGFDSFLFIQPNHKKDDPQLVEHGKIQRILDRNDMRVAAVWMDECVVALGFNIKKITFF